MKSSIFVVLTAILIAASLQSGTVPSMMNYQGRLTNHVNLPLDTVINMTFRIYAGAEGDTPLWTEQQNSVSVRYGLFTVLLGSTNPLLDTVFKSDIRWIGLQVGDDVEMSPRRQFATVAYAFRAAYADSVRSTPVGDSVWSVSNGNAWRMNGNVGIGTSTPVNRIEVNGDAKINELGLVGSWPEVMFNAHMGAGTPKYSSNGTAFSIFHAKDLNRLEVRKAGIGILGNQVFFDPAVVFTEDGRVGIGITHPDRALTVSVPVGTNDIARFRSENGNSDIVIGSAADQVAQVYTLGGQSLSIGTNGGNEQMRITSTGDVGIGTSIPGEKFEVVTGNRDKGLSWKVSSSAPVDPSAIVRLSSNNGRGRLTLGGPTDEGSIQHTTGGWQWNKQLNVMGPMGVGTTSPSVQLDVTGAIKGQTAVANVNAVEGTCAGNYSGVAGINTSTGNGVYGSAPGPGYAGYFNGNAYVENSLAIGTSPDARLTVGNTSQTAATFRNGSTEPTVVIINQSTGDGLYVGNTASAGASTYPLHVVSKDNISSNNGILVRGKSRIEGDLQVVGTLSKSSGSFKIDHPLDPENKWLYHSFVESPDMKNIYDGIAEFGSDGRAVVNMPEYFQTLNRDFRYQLTCIGGYAQVYIESEMKGNCFVIAGGKEGMKVSWQVTGTRQDQWAEQNRIKVEEEKTAEERGKVQYSRTTDVSSDERSEL